ncbi:MAG TPA: hypothetical protein VJ981_00855 [Gammaproteobacteria bacterium]|nr:hypothetical protein [Gammaproteobacteria bacterium]
MKIMKSGYTCQGFGLKLVASRRNTSRHPESDIMPEIRNRGKSVQKTKKST